MGGSHQLQVIVTGLSVPMGLAFEAGDLYITNTNTVPSHRHQQHGLGFSRTQRHSLRGASHEARPDHGILGSEYSHGFGL